MFDCPDELGAGQAADNSDHRSVESLMRQPRPSPLTVEQPEADDRGYGHHAEARDLEFADAKRTV